MGSSVLYNSPCGDEASPQKMGTVFHWEVSRFGGLLSVKEHLLICPKISCAVPLHLLDPAPAGSKKTQEDLGGSRPGKGY